VEECFDYIILCNENKQIKHNKNKTVCDYQRIDKITMQWFLGLNRCNLELFWTFEEETPNQQTCSPFLPWNCKLLLPMITGIATSVDEPLRSVSCSR